MYELQSLQGQEGTSVQVINEAAAKWEELAYGLHFEPHDVDNVKESIQPFDVTKACRKILQLWLEGRSRQPVEWNTLLLALVDAGQDNLASKLRTVLCCTFSAHLQS